MVFEVAGRAVNEVLPGRARHVDVTLTDALTEPGPVDRRTAILAPCVELSGAAVRARVEAAVRERLGPWLAEHPEQADAILRRIARRAD
ncbi:hypothetical protein [Streptomyces sp. NPDC021139]|uniref:hypothetical protein n=1 Tax=unclassified Streptomyces TaxID=2593676 RepID=UPI0034027E7A